MNVSLVRDAGSVAAIRPNIETGKTPLDIFLH